MRQINSNISPTTIHFSTLIVYAQEWKAKVDAGVNPRAGLDHLLQNTVTWCNFLLPKRTGLLDI